MRWKGVRDSQKKKIETQGKKERGSHSHQRGGKEPTPFSLFHPLNIMGDGGRTASAGSSHALHILIGFFK